MRGPGPERIQAFKDWLLERGRSQGTADLYGCNARNCLADARGATARLTREGLAPKTKRANLAALRAWCKFDSDGELLVRLDDLKLPPPERVKEKLPLARDEWDALIEAIPTVGFEPAVENAVEMICIRGFRVGDVCRLLRGQVRSGLASGLLNYRGKSGRQIEWSVAPFQHCLKWYLDQGRWRSVAHLVVHDCMEHRYFESARKKIRRSFRTLAPVIGLAPEDLSPHRLRRTYAVYFLQEVEGDLEKLRQHMGWASIATAAQYVDHSQREELDAIAARMAQRRSR
jgi:integrase